MIDSAGLEGLVGMNVGNITPQVDRFVFPGVHRVIVWASGLQRRCLPRAEGGGETALARNNSGRCFVHPSAGPERGGDARRAG